MEKRLTTMSDIKELKDEELEILNGGRIDGEKRKPAKAKTSTKIEECPQCGEEKFIHSVCPNCGYYKGKELIED